MPSADMMDLSVRDRTEAADGVISYGDNGDITARRRS